MQGYLGLLSFLIFSGLPLQAQGLTLQGRVVDENNAPVAAARIAVSPGAFQALSNTAGAFTLDLPDPGYYTVHVAREGYYELNNYPVHVAHPQHLTLVLNTVREVFQSVNVTDKPSPLDLAQAAKQQRLTGTEINDIPYPSSHSLRNAMRLMPGVVQDPAGTLHFNGSSENQVSYLLNGFNITDPISGALGTRLGMEGIHSLQYSPGIYSPETGKGSAGTLAIRTAAGTDQLRYTATNFIPGIDIQQGLRLGNWYPRFGLSGPIVRGRAWFADTFQSEYNQDVVTGLPAGQNSRSGWVGSNLLHTQVNVTPSNILFADFLVNLDNETGVGLGALYPLSTTSNVRSRQYFASLKDQVYLGRGALVEFGYAHNHISGRQAPLGQDLYVFSPDGRSGNNYLNSTQTATRDQALVDAFFPAFHFAGTHQLKAGVDADRLHYTGAFDRTGYQVYGYSGQLLSQTLFGAPASFRLPDTEFSSYVRDTWQLNKRLRFDIGVRQDWDHQIAALAWSPHLAFSWVPLASGRTTVTGGYAITHDAVDLGMLGRPLDQTAAIVHYNPDGSPAGPAAISTFTRGPGSLQLPRAVNWNLGVDHQFGERLVASVNYLRRRTSGGFAFVNTLDPTAPPFESPLPDIASDGVYQLSNLRNDRFDKVEFSVRQRFAGQYEWMASYTRSRALSNALLDFTTSQPVQLLEGLQPVPWDAPHRFLGWAYLPLPWKNWAVSAMGDARTGLPFSVHDETGRIVGPVDAYRYPLHFDLNVQFERMFTWHGYRFALRGGCNNVTSRANPTAVNNTIGGPDYLHFYGNEGRHFVVRIRFFGRKTGG